MAIRTKLMEHQAKIIQFCKNKEYSAIFSEYGTGKTLCALGLVQLWKARKTLVVSSKTAIMSTWPQEIERHTDFRYVHLLGTPRQKLNQLAWGLRESYTMPDVYHAGAVFPIVFLLNFDGVRNIYSELVASSFDAIIVDESTKIKSPKANRTKAMWSLGRGIPRRVIMTGFPITENIAEVYAQVKFLDKGATFGNSYYGFLDTYFYKAGFKRVIKKGAEKKIFKLIEPYSIRVTNEVLRLPPKVYETKEIQQTAKQRELLDELKDYFAVEFGKVSINTEYIFALLNKSLQICDGFLQDTKGNIEVVPTFKDDTLVDLLEDIDPRKNKVLIWAKFRVSVRKIKTITKRLGYNPLTLTGETENVDAVIKQFQFGKKHNILIATPKKASESITLTACNYAIYYSNEWSYDLRANSEARIRRKGSERHSSIFYTDLVVKDTVEKLVHDCLRKKKDLVGILKENLRTLEVGKK